MISLSLDGSIRSMVRQQMIALGDTFQFANLRHPPIRNTPDKVPDMIPKKVDVVYKMVPWTVYCSL